MKHRLFCVVLVLWFTLDISRCCRKNVDPLVDLRRRENNIPNDSLIQLLNLFLDTTSTSGQAENDLGPQQPSIKMYPGNINDHWTPSYYQFWKGQDLHSLVYLRKAIS